MAKFSEKFEDGLMLVAEKVDDNKYLGAIKNAFTTFMPFIIVGSFATLFNTLLCSTTTGLAAFIPSLASLSPAFTAINFATLSIMALPIDVYKRQLHKYRLKPGYLHPGLGIIQLFH